MCQWFIRLMKRVAPCECEHRLRQRALKAFDDANLAEQRCDHEHKRVQRVIAKSCLLGARFLSGVEKQGKPLVYLKPRSK